MIAGAWGQLVMTRPNPVRRGKSRPVAPTRRVGAPYRKRAPTIPVNELITSSSGEHLRKRASQDEEIGQNVDHIDRLELAGDTDRQAFMGELVEHVEHPILASIVGAVLDKVVGPDWRIASTMFWPCETRTSTCRNFATISSGLYRFLAIAVLLDVKDIPQVGPLQRGRIRTD
jgi:hypothetical protein